MEITVNGETIPSNLFEQERDRLHMDPESPPYDQLEEIVRDTLIARTLIRQAAIESGPAIPPEEIESSLADMIEDAGSEQSFYSRYGITGDQKNLVTDEIEVTLKIEQLINDVGKDAGEPTSEDIETYYKENADTLVEPQTVEARHIIMTVHCEHDALEVFEQMCEIRKELLDGGDFEKLALLHSVNGKEDRGDLGSFSRGDMLPEFEAIAFSMNPGEISPVFQTQYGYHIVNVTANNPKRPLSLEEATDKISAELRNRKKNELVENWVEERKKSAEISIVD